MSINTTLPAMTTTTTTPMRQLQSDIFSPRPSTPSTPPSFPFLNTPSPQLKRSKTTASPPTPPRRPRTRQTVSTGNVNANVFAGDTFESTLAAFPTPPARLSLGPSPDAGGSASWAFSSSSSAQQSAPQDARPKSQKRTRFMKDTDPSGEGAAEIVPEWTDDESDGKTVTGVPATPSTASSGWDTFWSEISLSACSPRQTGLADPEQPPSPAENKEQAEQALTEAAKIREAYLRSKLGRGQDEGEVYHIENA